MTANPFLDPDFHIRWSRLSSDAVVPAMEEALVLAEASIAVIANQPASAATYESTFLALDRATELVTLPWGKVTHLQSVMDSPALREAHNAVLPKVTAFLAAVPLNPKLWSVLRQFSTSAAGARVSGIRRRHMQETEKDFIQAGAELPAAEKARLEALQSELAQVAQKYSENVLDATNTWQLVVTDDARLAGLPAHAKAAARRSAEGKGLAGWRFTLHQPSFEPFMTFVQDVSLREEMWTASAFVGSRAPHDNTALVSRILALRAEKAAILGRAHFADLVLERRMAKSGAKALAFIENLERRAHPAFLAECRELEQFRAQQTGSPAVPLAPWDLAFWSEKLRQVKYSFDAELLRPYFPMDRVVAGMFELVGRVFGLRVVARPEGSMETWHPEVRCYDLLASDGRLLGSFYTDWHPRESKRGGAWMNYVLTGEPQPSGPRSPHLGMICGNMTPPADGRPAFLTHREVETIFHEFGHLLHHLLGEVEIKALNGINVTWDFVELPSQIMENWCWERESLDLFARHHETGHPIPEELYQRMIAARRFRSAFATMRQVAFAKMDLILHLRTREFIDVPDIEHVIRNEIAGCLPATEPPAPTIVKRFNHIFADAVGYAAGYYSYKWAEVLDADAFTRFRREGLFNRDVGRQFVDTILSRGNSADPAELFRAFMGRDPDLTALLERSGLVSAA
jgi:oligopeptidase A